jgi:hypothetical protein
MTNQITQSGGYKIEVDGDKISVVDMESGNILLSHDRNSTCTTDLSYHMQDSLENELTGIEWWNVVNTLFNDELEQLDNAFDALENACKENPLFQVSYNGIVYHMHLQLERCDPFQYCPKQIYSKKLTHFYDLMICVTSIKDFPFDTEMLVDDMNDQIVTMREDHADGRKNNDENFWLTVINDIPIEVERKLRQYFACVDTFATILNGLNNNGETRENILERFLKTSYADEIRSDCGVTDEDILKQSDMFVEEIAEALHTTLGNDFLIEIEN